MTDTRGQLAGQDSPEVTTLVSGVIDTQGNEASVGGLSFASGAAKD
jgi:hypothetical protein